MQGAPMPNQVSKKSGEGGGRGKGEGGRGKEKGKFGQH